MEGYIHSLESFGAADGPGTRTCPHGTGRVNRPGT